jgi:opacity protein-like surface antigen
MKVMRQLNRLAAGTAVAAIAAVAGAGLAQADGMPGKRVAYEKPWDWGGLYFGVHAGWQWSSIDVDFPLFGSSFGVQHDSPVAGGQIGLQHQFGQIVVGIEAGLTSAYQNNPGSDPCPNAALTCSARLDNVLTVGPRIGYAAGKWMPYITGGYANASFEGFARVNGTQVQTEGAQARLSGWYIGGGVEMALAHGWTLGLEYRHYDFEDKTVVGHSPAGVAIEPWRFDASSDSVTLRASWKLGRPDRVSPLK